MKDLLLKRRDPLKRYGLALVTTALALLIRDALPAPEGTTIYQLPLAALVVSAWYGGRGPGLVALVTSVAVLEYKFIPPVDSFQISGDYALGLVLYIALGLLLTEFSAARRRVEQALEESQREIVALNERLMKAQEEERARIAGELHDGLAQQMTTVNLLLGSVKRQLPPDSRTKATIDEAQEILIGMGSDVRHLSHELFPPLLKEAGLPSALRAYCKEFSRTRGIPVSCEADSDFKELSPGTALALYRITQEALGNTAKHSKAKQVRVRLTRAQEVVRLIVSDDGVGFVPGRAGGSGGVGLLNMRERARVLNGAFELKSHPGDGTTIRAEVPFRPA
jgi:signal transduction histidine kinase